MEKGRLNTESRNKTWVCFAALTAVFALSFREFIFEGRIVFEGMEAWQYFPVSMHYFQSLIHDRYPFYDFLFSVGFDSLGDSQQQLMHPLKILMVLSGLEPVKINTYFLIAHFFVGMMGIYLYAQFMLRKSYGDSSTNAYGMFFAPTLIFLSLAVYTNIPHMVFGCTLAYFPFMLLLVEKIISEPKRRYFFFLALVVTLILFIGNYGMQWITLLFTVMYLVGRVLMERRSVYRTFIVLLAIAFGFFVALVQLVPTFDLMQTSSRSLLGRLDMFHQSANPLAWLGYLSPGALYLQFKYAHEAFWSYTGNNVIEGVHYMGLVPLALVFYSIWKRKILPREINLLHGMGLVTALRALGVFSIINIFLNALPIFGQFRIPVRTFFVVDFVLAMISAYVLVSNIDRNVLRKVISTLLAVTFIFNIFNIISLGLWEAVVSRDLPAISFLEYGYPFGGCLILLLALILVSERFSAVIDKKQLVFGLIILSMLDLGFHRLGVPLHWGNPVAQEIKTQNAKVDEYCRGIGVSRIWMDFEWPDHDAPRFPFTSSKGPRYEDKMGNYEGEGERGNIELHGTSCYFGDSVITSTLTPISVKKAMIWAKEELTHDEFLSFMGILGYSHYAKLKSETTRIIRIEDINVQEAPSPTRNMLEKFEEFLTKQPAARKGLFKNIYEPAYEMFVRFGLSGWLPRHHFEPLPVPGVGSVFALTQPMYYMLLDDRGEILPYETKGTFLILPEGVEGPVEVVYVPIGFVVGLLGSIVGFALLLFVSLTRILNPIFRIYNEELEDKSLGAKCWTLLCSKLARIWSLFLEFLVGSWLKTYGGVFLIGSLLAMPLAAYFMTRKDFAFPFVFLVFLLMTIYLFTRLLSDDKKIALGLTIFIGSNFIIGKVYYILTAILFVSRKSQLLVMERLPFLAAIFN